MNFIPKNRIPIAKNMNITMNFVPLDTIGLASSYTILFTRVVENQAHRNIKAKRTIVSNTASVTMNKVNCKLSELTICSALSK